MSKIPMAALGILLYGFSAFAAAPSGQPIAIGDIGMGVAAPEASLPCKEGMDLAVNEVNAKGGVLGRPFQVLHRDGKMNPGEAVRLAEELAVREKVSLLISSEGSGSTLALGNWAAHKRIPLIDVLADADSILWEQGNPYVFRTGFGGYMEIDALLGKALAIHGDKLKKKRWAVLAPNYEYGRSLVTYMKLIVQNKGLEPEWVVEQWPAFGKMDAGATIAALARAKPDIIFSLVATDDLGKFVREGTKRALFKDRIVLAPTLAFPEHMTMLGAEMPVGWISIGFPVEDISTPRFVSFKQDYKAAYGREPQTMSLFCYNTIYAAKAGFEKAGTADDPVKLREALAAATYETPFGPERFRKIDGQAETSFWVGVSGLKDGKPVLLDWSEEKAVDHLPPDSFILERRKGQ